MNNLDPIQIQLYNTISNNIFHKEIMRFVKDMKSFADIELSNRVLVSLFFIEHDVINATMIEIKNMV